jgi:predicted nucleotide-binding protein
MSKAATKIAKIEKVPEAGVGKIKSEFPKHTLEDATKLPLALTNSNGGRPLPPLETAAALEISPGSSDFRVLLSSGYKYGLTSGSYKQEKISQEALGRRIAEPTSAEDRDNALVSAALTPPTFKSIYEYFKGKKLPERQFFENTVIREFSVPREHAARCIEIFTKNMKFVGLVKELPTGSWLSTEKQSSATPVEEEIEGLETGLETDPEKSADGMGSQNIPSPPTSARISVGTNRVYVAHGKSKDVLHQLKDLLTFGGFEPVLSLERETTAEPVPQKIIGDMRSCSAAIINVTREQELIDADGKQHHVLNENVLIEIGAAMALYDKNFILLVQEGVHLPTDLQGLYRCDYQGSKLDYEATMKLLKTFSQFRKK